MCKERLERLVSDFENGNTNKDVDFVSICCDLRNSLESGEIDCDFFEEMFVRLNDATGQNPYQVA